MAPATPVRPPTTAIVSVATMTWNSSTSGEITRIVCTYSAPAMPAYTAESRKATNRRCQMSIPSDIAAMSFSRITVYARPRSPRVRRHANSAPIATSPQTNAASGNPRGTAQPKSTTPGTPGRPFAPPVSDCQWTATSSITCPIPRVASAK